MLSSDDKALLLLCINCYLDKMNFVLNNRRYYLNTSNFIFDIFEQDINRLCLLRDKLCSFDNSPFLLNS